MRKSGALVLLVVLSWLGGPNQDAQAGVTFDVLFQDGTGSALTIMEGDAGPGCSFGGRYGGSVSTGRCMDVVLTSTVPIIFIGVSVQYDDTNGLVLHQMYEWIGVGVVFDPETGDPMRSCAPTGGLVDNGGGFGSGVGLQSFDCGVRFSGVPYTMPPGTYQLGTIIWDTSGMTGPSTSLIAAAIDQGVDGVVTVINGILVNISTSVVLGGHFLTVIPEPGTASLLGLGLVGLVIAARRRVS